MGGACVGKGGTTRRFARVVIEAMHDLGDIATWTTTRSVKFCSRADTVAKVGLCSSSR
jgi:hypothetical protein